MKRESPRLHVVIDAESLERANRTGHPRLLSHLLNNRCDVLKGVYIDALTWEGAQMAKKIGGDESLIPCDACHQPYPPDALADVCNELLCPICRRGMQSDGAVILAEAMERANAD